MRWAHALPALASALPTALGAANLKFLHPELAAKQFAARENAAAAKPPPVEKRQQTQPLFLTDQIRGQRHGPSRGQLRRGRVVRGLLPIEGNDTSNELFFWFFPSTNPVAQEKKEILIWLTGGPGCSSVGELLQENGPVLWQPGVFAPVANKWSWHHLTNVVWVDQPIGSGFSHGEVTARNEQDVARQFLGFWKNFVDAFALQGYTVYVTGSSYSGMYTPYISSAMLDQNDTAYYNLSGMMIFDGLFSKQALATDIPVASFVNQWTDVFAFNDSFTQGLQAAARECGYMDYLEKYLVFPAAGQQPASLPGQQADDLNETPGCGLFIDVYFASMEINPCFSVYEIADRCPLVFDPLGFSVGTDYMPVGSGPVYFDRADVKAAIHALPNQTWEFCASQPVFVNGTDDSVNAGPGSQPVIPHVVDRTQNVLIGHGSQDFVLIADGTLLAIQNMTWGGQLGFQERPAGPLYVPYHVNDNFETITGAGVIGTAHTERGLTYFGVAPSGHFLTMDQPAVSFRGLEILLGRIENFQSTQPFTIEIVNATVQPSVALGNGTVLAGLVDPGQIVAINGNGTLITTGESSTQGVSAVPTSAAAAVRGSVAGKLAASLLCALAVGVAALL
ncbi:serine carboxypeptidase [Lasiosphaeria ovina]|uniref:Serine carboxypeptidase n=1 Tax=Lasiosphaeria ovina TaxID=92902 RepID=A0AAE0JSK7_9PEZI|nr:serine carboxypeptidase [Lasiosphaeria ovina]